MNFPLFTGCATALITPFLPDGRLDEPALRRLLAMQIAAKMDALVLLGTTGEPCTLSMDERERIIEIGLECTGGSIPVIRAIEYARQAQRLGAAGQLSVTPYYNKTTQSGLIRHYHAILDACPLPMILYNVPGRTGMGLSADTAAALSRHPSVVGLKEASGNSTLTGEILEKTRGELPIYCGNDDQILPMMAQGSCGAISVVSNILPDKTRALTRACLERRMDDAQARAEALLANYTSSSKTNPSLAVVYGIKARAYLWLGGFDSSKYADAATYARKAIDASKCTIMTEAEWLNPKTGFNKANNSWMWYLPQSTEGIANLVNFAAWRSSEATWGYGGKYVFEGVTSNFYNEISDTDWRKRAFVGPDAKYADYSDITNLTAAQFANLPAYANLKFHPAEGETATYSVGNVTDIPMMRVEEMYLIEAEATAHADASAGLQLLKTFMAKRDPEFSTSAVSSADVVEEIIWNKRIELWGEGVVFYDFKRLNYSLKTGYVGTNVPSGCRFSTDGRAPWWNFCIPETETHQNTALESQNNPNPVGIIDPWVQ